VSGGDRARITRVVASNFLSLGEAVSVDLGDLTVLAGINGSGKSNVIAALVFIANAIDDGLEHAVVSRRGFRALRRHGVGRAMVRLRYELEAATWEGDYEVAIGGKADGSYEVSHEIASITYRDQARHLGFNARKGVLVDPGPELVGVPVVSRDLLLRVIGGVEGYGPLRDALSGLRRYAIYPGALREPSKPSALAHLDCEGHNWASIVRRVAAGRFGGELRAALARVTGDIVDLRVEQLGDNLAVLFRHHLDGDPLDRDQPDGDRPSSGPWFDAGRESDGTLRIAGLLTALLQEPPLTLIAIEEPELTIHPGAIPLVVDFLRMATSWSQVLVTTHSPELLEAVDPDELRVVQRLGGVTSVAGVDAGQVELVRRELTSPGELMRREGLAPQESAP
jgi:hypothetical protein